MGNENRELRDARLMSRRAFLAVAGLTTATVGLGAIGCTPDDEVAPQEDAGEELDLTPEELLEREITETIAGLTLEQKVAQLFVVRPEPVFGGTALTAAGAGALAAFQQYPVAGFCLFGANLADPDQTKAFLSELSGVSQETLGFAPFLAIDEEGGLVARVANNDAFGQTNVGDMRDVGDTGDVQVAADAAAYMASYLTPLGFNVDFAPVCDIATASGEGTMETRAFSNDPSVVSAMAAAQIEQFQAAGIMPCAKHFPGIGASRADTHDGSAYLNCTLDELRAHEFLPFEAAIDAGVPLIMIGHISLPKVLADEENPGLPASLSHTVVTGILREELGFDGVVITDALEMGAVIDAAGGDDPSLLAIEAGCDLALIPADFGASYANVLEAARSGRMTEARIDESLRRTLRARLNLR